MPRNRLARHDIAEVLDEIDDDEFAIRPLLSNPAPRLPQPCIVRHVRREYYRSMEIRKNTLDVFYFVPINTHGSYRQGSFLTIHWICANTSGSMVWSTGVKRASTTSSACTRTGVNRFSFRYVLIASRVTREGLTLPQ